MKKNNLTIFLLFVLILTSVNLKAQSKEEKTASKKNKTTALKSKSKKNIALGTKDKRLSLSFTVGPTIQYTDIKNLQVFRTSLVREEWGRQNQIKVGGTLNARYMFNRALGLQGQILITTLSGIHDSRAINDNRGNYSHMINPATGRAFSNTFFFKTNIFESSAQLYINWNNLFWGISNRAYDYIHKNKPLKKRIAVAYTTVGIGVLFWRSVARDLEITNLSTSNGDLLSVHQLVYPSLLTNRLALVFPIATGVKFRITQWLDWGVEVSAHFARTDRLEGLAVQHPHRMKNDAYLYLGTGAVFKFGGKKSAGREHVDWIQPVKNPKNKNKDTDGDGVIDDKDYEINSPAGAKVDRFGVTIKEKEAPKDTDGDGVTDDKDYEINSPAGAKVDQFGVTIKEKEAPKDTDGDGVTDDKDYEINSPAGAKVDRFGVTIPDADGDGVADRDDKCPQTAGLASNEGCPEIDAADQAVLDFAFQNLEFESGRDIIRLSSYNSLNSLADLLNRKTTYRLRIAGHTDSQGAADANYALSQKRANAVKQFLTDRGVASYRLETEAYGETRPIADNATAEGRQKNRRVEMNVVFE